MGESDSFWIPFHGGIIQIDMGKHRGVLSWFKMIQDLKRTSVQLGLMDAVGDSDGFSMFEQDVLSHMVEKTWHARIKHERLSSLVSETLSNGDLERRHMRFKQQPWRKNQQKSIWHARYRTSNFSIFHHTNLHMFWYLWNMFDDLDVCIYVYTYTYVYIYIYIYIYMYILKNKNKHTQISIIRHCEVSQAKKF